jgi:hypothetical protein
LRSNQQQQLWSPRQPKSTKPLWRCRSSSAQAQFWTQV